MMRIEPVTAPVQLAEGPLWDADAGRLMWVDIGGHTVHAFDPHDGDTAIATEQPPAALALIEGSSDYLLAAGLTLSRLAWPSGRLTEVATVTAGSRTNDGGVDPSGRYLVGTMIGDDTDAAALYRVEGGAVTEVAAGVRISNGLDWSLDGRTLYYVDTPLERIDAFDYDPGTGTLSSRRVFVDLADVPGRPDGLTVDAEGGVWVAMARGGSAVRRFLPDGGADRVIDLPVPNVTSLTFGGADLDQLYVTTGQLGMTEDDLRRWPTAGSVFRITDTGIRGRLPGRYRL